MTEANTTVLADHYLTGSGRRIPRRVLAVFAWATLLSNALISVTGAVVRVTGSGLGCTTWPECHPGTLVPEYRTGMAAIHQAIEFGNRTITGIVLAASLGTFLLLVITRPRRRQLIYLSGAIVAGVVFQAIWGGITVLLGLAWWTVAPHLLASLVLVFLASILVVRLGESDESATALVPRPLAALSWITAAALGAVTVTGTLTTSAGPHAGDVTTARLSWDLRTVAQAHADLMFLYLGLIAAMAIAWIAVRAPAALKRRTWWLVGLTAAQGLLGLTQYFLGVPEVLVVAHVALAVALTAVASFVCMATRIRC